MRCECEVTGLFGDIGTAHNTYSSSTHRIVGREKLSYSFKSHFVLTHTSKWQGSEKFAPKLSVSRKVAKPHLGHHINSVLIDPACCHAAVRGLNCNSDAVWFQRVEQRLRDLLGQAFLQLQPAGEGIDQA